MYKNLPSNTKEPSRCSAGAHKPRCYIKAEPALTGGTLLGKLKSGSPNHATDCGEGLKRGGGRKRTFYTDHAEREHGYASIILPSNTASAPGIKFKVLLQLRLQR